MTDTKTFIRKNTKYSILTFKTHLSTFAAHTHLFCDIEVYEAESLCFLIPRARCFELIGEVAVVHLASRQRVSNVPRPANKQMCWPTESPETPTAIIHHRYSSCPSCTMKNKTTDRKGGGKKSK